MTCGPISTARVSPCGEFEQHQALAALAVVDLGPVNAGVDVAARHEILVANPASAHPRNAIDQIAGPRSRLEFLNVVDDGIAERGNEGRVCIAVLVQPNEI